MQQLLRTIKENYGFSFEATEHENRFEQST